MTAFEENNRAYLVAALAWLRLRLQGLSLTERPAALPMPLGVAPPKAPAAGPPARRTWWAPWRRTEIAVPSVEVLPAAPPAPPSVPPEAPRRHADELAAATRRLREAEAATPPPALTVLAHTFGLSPFERDVVLLCAAMELDPSLPAACARAAGDTTRPWPTFGLALEAFDEPRWDVLSPDRPLRHFRFLEINQSGVQPLVSAPLRIDERIGAYVRGANYLDERLGALMQPLETGADEEEATPPPSQQASVDAALAILATGAAADASRVCLQLVGADAASRRRVASAISARLSQRPLVLSVDNVPASGEVDAFVRLWDRECRLLPLVVLVDLPDADLSAESAIEANAPRARLIQLAQRMLGVVLLSTQEPVAALARASIVDVRRSTPDEQAAAWRDVLGPDSEPIAEELAAQFSLDASTIHTIARTVRDETNPERRRDRLWVACATQSRPALEGLAQRIEARVPWSALKLPKREAATLERIRDQMRQRAVVHGRFGFRDHLSRGLGTTALFCGESGTGKTLAAEVLAAELRLPLYRIDLAGIMNKYIGVTEKHIRRVFDAGAGAILFFDEADALFGKRSEVKDSHDRYANIQVDYLLQRMESHTGLAILATNMRSAIDPAFLRRFRFVMTFPFPGPAEREAIWRGAFPEKTPLGDDVDLSRLSRVALTGGSIQNAAIDAAFRAAASGGPVTMAILVESAREELRKLEHTTSSSLLRLASDRTTKASG
jgi:hypothetical protein